VLDGAIRVVGAGLVLIRFDNMRSGSTSPRIHSIENIVPWCIVWCNRCDCSAVGE
jgi:hypothetical protein